MATNWQRLARWRSAGVAGGWRHLVLVAAAYLAITFAVTWPLVRGLGRDLPADLADPLLNCWILAWGSEHIGRFLGGDWGAFQGFWSTNVFYPHTLTLAYSEHMIVPALQAAPIYGLSGNIILAYNCLFLSTFVLSGVGAYLLAYDLIGDRRAAFVAGLLFAFTPYRFSQISHLQVMSSQWMPFALLGVRRYIVTGRRRYCVGALVALICQGLSCGYYLLYFSPFVALYAVWEMARQGRLKDLRTWVTLVLAGLMVACVSLPFLLPYMELRTLQPTARSLLTVREGSADVFSYVTSDPRSPLWGSVLTAIKRGEAQLFPGLATLVLAGCAIVAAFARRLAITGSEQGVSPRRRIAVRLALGLVAFFGVALTLDLAGQQVHLHLGIMTLTAASIERTFVMLVLATAALLLLSRRAREFFGGWSRSATLFLVLFVGVAAYLSLGPVPCALAQRLRGPSLYGVLMDYVPGFDGLRVPARYAMIVSLGLALLGGLGSAALARGRRLGRWAAVALPLLFLVEAPYYPLPINRSWGSAKVKPPKPPQIGAQLPTVYRYVQGMPRDVVLLEMPMGYTCYETRYMFYSISHWRRIANGYSGYFPEEFMELATALKRIVSQPEEGLAALRRSGATHVILHRDAWIGRRAGRVERALKRGGLTIVADFGEAAVLAMPAQAPNAGR